MRPKAPGVFKRHLLGNRLLAHVAIQHFLFGVTLGSLETQIGVGNGALFAVVADGGFGGDKFKGASLGVGVGGLGGLFSAAEPGGVVMGVHGFRRIA